MDKRHDTVLETLMERLIEGGAENMGLVFARVFDLAMQIERERFLGAQHYERSPSRQGYANGYKAKRIDTPAGTVTVNVPKTAVHDGEPFYPQSLERGFRSTRAGMLAVAEMYVKSVATREVEAVMREFGIESLSSSQVSRAAKLIDDELEAWRNRPLGEIKYLTLDDHAGLRAARKAVLGGVKWQRCQFHLAQNAIHHSPNLAIHKRIGAELRTVWNAPNLKATEIALADLVKAYQPTAPKLADWLEKNVPEG